MSNTAGMSEKSGLRRRALNPRALVILGCVTCILYFGGRRLHSFQFDKTRQFLRSTAMDALRRGDIGAASTLLSQYLAMKPSDIEAKEQFSKLLVDHLGTSAALERAFRINEDLLRDRVPQHDLRLRQAQLAIRMQRFSDAESHLKVLHSAMPESSEVWYLSGRVAEEMRKPDAAKGFYNRAVQSPQPVPEAFAALAEILRSEKADPATVTSLLNEMVSRCPPQTAASIRAEWLMRDEMYAAAMEDLWNALKHVPNDLRLNTLLVQCFQKSVLPAEGSRGPSSTDPVVARIIRHFETIAEAVDQNTVLCLNHSAVLWHAGQRRNAIMLLEEGIRRHPADFQLHSTLIEYLLGENRVGDARLVLERLPSGALDRSESDYLNGRVQMGEGRWEDAVKSLESGIAFAESGSSIPERAHLALAMALRHTSSRRSPAEAYRDVLSRTPDSVTGRLGVAAAWLESGNYEMAIAEYRQLLHVPGVPAWLASRIIRHNLNQREVLRDWTVFESLVRDDQPVIEDPVQRILLRADMLLASGKVVEALNLTEQAVQKYPTRPEPGRALRKLTGDQSEEIRKRLLQVIQQDVRNAEAHAMLLRMDLGSADTDAVSTGLEELVSGKKCPGLGDEERLQLASGVLHLTEQMERSSGRTSHKKILQDLRTKVLEALVRHSPEELPTLAGYLAATGRSVEAKERVKQRQPETTPDQRVLACLQLVRFSANRQHDFSSAAEIVFDLIRQHPENIGFRLAYAEMLLYVSQYEPALESLQQVLQMDAAHPVAKARLAWICAVTGSERDKAERLAVEALQISPDSAQIRGICGRVQLELGRFEEALKTAEGTGGEFEAASAMWVCRAAALMALKQNDLARSAVDRVIDSRVDDPLLPADEKLLQSVLDELQLRSTVAR